VEDRQAIKRSNVTPGKQPMPSTWWRASRPESPFAMRPHQKAIINQTLRSNTTFDGREMWFEARRSPAGGNMRNVVKTAIAMCAVCGCGFAAWGEDRAPNLDAITAIVVRQAAASRPLFSSDLALVAPSTRATTQAAPAPPLPGAEKNSVPSANLSTTGRPLAPAEQTAAPAQLPNSGLVPATQE
jgi:hypothetical protein